MRNKGVFENPGNLAKHIKAARGEIDCDLVIRNVSYLDVFTGEFLKGAIAVLGQTIVGVGEDYQGKMEQDGQGLFAVPGFIDAHVHVESSLMTPRRFEEAVLPYGTTTAIWDPHEITNVKGILGIEWALAATKNLLMDIFVMVPSCVPSTTPSFELETSGAALTASDIAKFVGHEQVLGLAEMMNFPGLLSGDPDVLQKLVLFQNKKRDGHCPALSGKDLNAYGLAGIHSCHESTTKAEALEKMQKGIALLIREGSCAKNAAELLPLINAYSSAVVSLCSDDRNPYDIKEGGHIDFIVNLGLKNKQAASDLFRAASYSAAKLYGLNDRGALAPGYLADFCLLKRNHKDHWQHGFTIETVVKKGQIVDQKKLRNHPKDPEPALFQGKNLNIKAIDKATFALRMAGQKKAWAEVIHVVPNQIFTERKRVKVELDAGGVVVSDRSQDILPIAVVERHHATGRVGLGLVHGFSLKKGAIATSINHDSHNIIVVGVDSKAMHAAVERLLLIDGGIVVSDGAGRFVELALPFGGLMTDLPPEEVVTKLQELKSMVKALGCSLYEPFLQLSFLALPVIPKLKITDRGLVDVETFKIINVLDAIAENQV